MLQSKIFIRSFRKNINIPKLNESHVNIIESEVQYMTKFMVNNFKFQKGKKAYDSELVVKFYTIQIKIGFYKRIFHTNNFPSVLVTYVRFQILKIIEFQFNFL